MNEINWDEKQKEWANNMCSSIWNEGSFAQQDIADDLVESFCQRFSKYLCLSVKDNLINIDVANNIVDHLFFCINSIDDAKWWCNKKNINDFIIAKELLQYYEDDIVIIDMIKNHILTK